MPRLIVVDSITQLPPDARGGMAIAGSHGGVYAAYCAVRAGLRAVIFNDAGIGRERAGVAGLDYLEGFGIAATTVSHRSARIGNGADTQTRGVLSTVNPAAAKLGIKPGMSAGEAARQLLEHAPEIAVAAPEQRETRVSLLPRDENGPAVALLDSAALIGPPDQGQIVVTGSHGGLVGEKPESALKIEAFAAVFNDADLGIDGAGITRLPALDRRGVAAATVSAWSARIGDGPSIYGDGIISHINETARRYGGEIGISARRFVDRMRQAGKERA